MSPSTAVCSILALGFLLTTAYADPISRILDAYPDFTRLNRLLVSSGIDKLIDREPSVTLLALNNDEIDRLSALKKPKEMEAILKAHVIVDYFDDVKLRHLRFSMPQETVTLLQFNVTDQANSKQGLLKVIRTEEGIYFQSSGRKASPGDAKFVDRIYARQFNISVLKLDHTIYIDGLTGELEPVNVPVPPKNATAPVVEVEGPESPAEEVTLPDESIAPSMDAESSKNSDEDEATDAKSAAGKITFGLVSLIISASCIAAGL